MWIARWHKELAIVESRSEATVLSAKKSPLAVEARIEAFLEQWRSKLVDAQNFGGFLTLGLV